MLFRGKLLPSERKYLGVLLWLPFMVIVCVAFNRAGKEEFTLARREVLLRRIGHEILLQSGDSVSRVLPVKKIGANEYQVSFAHAFGFQPETLVGTTRRILAKDPLAGDYVVNVLNCSDGSVAYAFAVSKNKKEDIVACIGRKQPAACYRIHIRFGPEPMITARQGLLLGSLALLALVGFVLLKALEPQPAAPVHQPAAPEAQPAGLPHTPAPKFVLGTILFDAEARKLLIGEEVIDLTKTEARVLRMFAAAPNEVIPRSQLQKEIWEDEGVIVGRSLDMFISKLRKKLEPDPNISIVVLRGKGYKLQISA